MSNSCKEKKDQEPRPANGAKLQWSKFKEGGMPCQRIIFPGLQNVHRIAVTRNHKKWVELFRELFRRNPLTQLELDDFHVLRAVKDPIGVASLHENPQTAITHPDNHCK